MKISFLFFFFFQSIYSMTTNFSMEIPAKSEKCIFEYFPDETLVIIQVKSSLSNIDFWFLDSSGNEINRVEKETSFKHSFTTFDGGFYSMCAKNRNNYNKSKQKQPKENDEESNTAMLEFVIKHGIAAKDYSSVSTMQDLKPVEVIVSI